MQGCLKHCEKNWNQSRNFNIYISIFSKGDTQHHQISASESFLRDLGVRVPMSVQNQELAVFRDLG